MFPHASLHTRDRRTHHRVSLRLVHAGGGADRRRSGRVGIGRARPLHLGGPERASRHRPGRCGSGGGGWRPWWRSRTWSRSAARTSTTCTRRKPWMRPRNAGWTSPRSRDRHRRIGPGACVFAGTGWWSTNRPASRWWIRSGPATRSRRRCSPGLRSSGRRRTWCRNSRGPHSGRSSNSPRPPPPSPAGAAGADLPAREDLVVS